MPEFPDVELYRERMQALMVGRPIEAVRLGSPFLVRSVDPPLSVVAGREVQQVRRLGKQLIIGLQGDLWLVIHLMIAGRLRMKKRGASHRGRDVQAVFDLPSASLVFTEASKKKRAKLHVVGSEAGLADFDQGGLELFPPDRDAFAERLRSRKHTLKRSLTDPRLLSGIGNAYSDEILFAAKLSPVRMSTALDDDEVTRLHTAVIEVLTDYTDRMRAEIGQGFPDKVTAFRDDFHVHGRYKKPCRVCGDPVQRIVRGDHETNYCATCQNSGRLLADRALSRLLKSDWPKTLEELEERKREG